ncbi:MAG: BACON domain-containing protein, partial [Desulfosarcinaceae bacterium]|nr:BACON domain-containing protein [Desulfosarcinaceae bacterium]
GGGSYTVNVDAAYEACSWNTAESIGWISLSPRSGTGDGPVTVTVDPNSGPARSATITIAGQSHRVSQAGARHEITGITLSPTSPARLELGNRVNIRFNYYTDEAGGVRIFVEPYTRGAPTPNRVVSGSTLYPAGSGSGAGYFYIRNVATTVDQVRVWMTNADQSRVLFERFLSVSYVYYLARHEVTSIAMTPASPASVLLTFRVNLSFNYYTDEAGGVRIFVEPYTSGSPTPNRAVSPSPLYAAGSGTGEGFFTITEVPVTVDQVRVWMTNADQSRILFERFIPVTYFFYQLL